MGLIDKIFGSGKISVTFIDAITGETIGVAKMQPDQLPDTFSVHTTMTFEESEWTVDEAIPENSTDFIKTRQLVLKLRKIEKVNLQDILFTLPSISNEIPQVEGSCLYNDFEVSIHEDDWRQKEFLRISAFPLIDIEVSKIKDILINESKKVDDAFTAFKKCHVRDTIGEPGLTIDLTELKDLLNVEKTGSLKINNECVRSSFSLQTESTTYYGTLVNNIVTELCISQWNKNTTSEIKKITKLFDLVFINWYHCDIIEGK